MSYKKRNEKKNLQDLRWGFSTGASMSALALCAWHFIQYKEEIQYVPVYFLDGCERLIPVLSQKEILSLQKKNINFASNFLEETSSHASPNTTSPSSPIVALYKDGGDDPDCTHNALIYARLSKASLEEAINSDYILQINNASLIIKCIEGIGLCTRDGLDCEQGKWAITHGPRQMLMENLSHANMQKGAWLLEVGIRRGEILAKNTLNPLLGVIGGVSLLGTTGLVRPYSHEAYLHTIHVCVKAHALSFQKTRLQEKQSQNTEYQNNVCHDSSSIDKQTHYINSHSPHMVFCTGGRTRKGAELYLPHLPESAFTPIGDFIAESLKIACQYDMQTITVACMAGKLCKYAAGFTNTHAHKVEQDMDLLREELRQCLPENKAIFCLSLQNAPSVREALLFIPEEFRIPLLEQLSIKALSQFRSWCGDRPTIQILVFNFDGTLLFQKNATGNIKAKPRFEIIDTKQSTPTCNLEEDTAHTNSKVIVTRNYFVEKMNEKIHKEEAI